MKSPGTRIVLFTAAVCIISTSILSTYSQTVINTGLESSLSNQQKAAQHEITRIQSRERFREFQLQQAVLLYSKMNRIKNIHPYQNHYKTNYVMKYGVQIVQDLYQDRLADQKRFAVLDNKSNKE